jgi:hypothetical protein
MRVMSIVFFYRKQQGKPLLHNVLIKATNERKANCTKAKGPSLATNKDVHTVSSVIFVLRVKILLSAIFNSSVLPNTRIVHFKYFPLSTLGNEVSCTL